MKASILLDFAVATSVCQLETLISLQNGYKGFFNKDARALLTTKLNRSQPVVSFGTQDWMAECVGTPTWCQNILSMFMLSGVLIFVLCA